MASTRPMSFRVCPSWLVFDSTRRAAPVGPLSPESPDPDWLLTDSSIGGTRQKDRSAKLPHSASR